MHKVIPSIPVDRSVDKVDFFHIGRAEFHYGNISCRMQGNLLQYK